MRFLRDGPSIPDALLTARDEGRVVFFCGAGVSCARAKLPNFFELADAVVDSLGDASDSPSRQLLETARRLAPISGVGGIVAADRIFGLLERNFDRDEIGVAVAKALDPQLACNAKPDLSAHKMLLDLAYGPDGRTRLVTTNFDLLFEACNSALATFSPPKLPDPRRPEELDGIVHLHGRVRSTYEAPDGDGLVISSSDFGHAYLADGWATEFIKRILARYLVVFVGYTADDPPVQYLLEAINRNSSDTNGLYAFHAGGADDAVARWGHKGVVPIAYEPGEGHKGLWETLEKWAVRARNPDAWFEALIGLAKSGPSDLEPYERGQVQHVVSTVEGARRFAESNDPPPSTWLCVFDPSLRYDRPREQRPLDPDADAIKVDPFDLYGLDSDIPPVRVSNENQLARREVPKDAWDAFALSRSDRISFNDGNVAQFRGHWSSLQPRLPKRLEYMAAWLAKCANQPTALWWASGQASLHSGIKQNIEWRLNQNDPPCSTAMRRAWQILLAAQRLEPDIAHHRWFDLARQIKLDGWDSSVTRRFIEINSPKFVAKRTYRWPLGPPEKFEVERISDIVDVDVDYPNTFDNVQIPNDQLLSVVRGLRRCLELAHFRESELGGLGLDWISSLRPEQSEGDTFQRSRGLSRLLLYYVELLDKLAQLSTELAVEESCAWPSDDDTIFARLRIWAAGHSRVAPPTRSGNLLLSLSDEAFWDSYHSRDLMHTLADRWSDWPKGILRKIERRILKGPCRYSTEEDDKYMQRRAWSSVSRVEWLRHQGCIFLTPVDKALEKLKKQIPDWKPEYAAGEVSSMDGRVRSVKTDTTFSALLGIPLSEVLEKADELEERDWIESTQRSPFKGLAAARPIRAFSALRLAAKRGIYQERAWREFLNSRTDSQQKDRLVRAIAAEISRFPSSTICELIHPISDWVKRVSEQLLQPPQISVFNKLWQRILDSMRVNPSCGQSGIIRTSDGIDWATEAINSPPGELAQAIMNDPRKEDLSAGKGFPDPWLGYVSDLLSLDGDRRRHALVIFAFNLNWFFHIDPEWTEQNILKLVDEAGTDADAIWAGFFWSARIPTYSFFMRLKDSLLNQARTSEYARREHGEILAGILLAAWGSDKRKKGDKIPQCIASDEMRETLLAADDEFRTQVLWQLHRWVSGEEGTRWLKILPEFLTEVWPRQKGVKTPRTSAQLCELALENAKEFPRIVDLIVPITVSIEREEVFFGGLRRTEDEIIKKHPQKLLELMIHILPADARKWPYGVNEVLDKLAATHQGINSDARFVELKRRWDGR